VTKTSRPRCCRRFIARLCSTESPAAAGFRQRHRCRVRRDEKVTERTFQCRPLVVEKKSFEYISPATGTTARAKTTAMPIQNGRSWAGRSSWPSRQRSSTGGASRRSRLAGGVKARNHVQFFPCREAPALWAGSFNSAPGSRSSTGSLTAGARNVFLSRSSESDQPFFTCARSAVITAELLCYNCCRTVKSVHIGPVQSCKEPRKT
jgi:hypothetical protein